MSADDRRRGTSARRRGGGGRRAERARRDAIGTGRSSEWPSQVHLKFKLVPETLYLTVNLIDRFLERAQVARSKLQLVGVTALLLASKYEEIYPPEIRDLVYITDRAYSKTDILCMESTILNKLEFNLTVPSVGVFLARYLKAAHADKWPKLSA